MTHRPSSSTLRLDDAPAQHQILGSAIIGAVLSQNDVQRNKYGGRPGHQKCDLVSGLVNMILFRRPMVGTNAGASQCRKPQRLATRNRGPPLNLNLNPSPTQPGLQFQLSNPVFAAFA